MFNPDTAPYYEGFVKSFRALPQQSSVEVNTAHVRSAAEVEAAVAELLRQPGGSLIAPGDPYVLSVRGTILKAANQYKLPVISPYRQFVVEGSLISYGPDMADIFRRSSSYVDRILKGESAGNLPAQSPDKFESHSFRYSFGFRRRTLSLGAAIDVRLLFANSCNGS
jgi:putative tryptophan/tyrosine transport system substrate-binding protein